MFELITKEFEKIYANEMMKKYMDNDPDFLSQYKDEWEIWKEQRHPLNREQYQRLYDEGEVEDDYEDYMDTLL